MKREEKRKKKKNRGKEWLETREKEWSTLPPPSPPPGPPTVAPPITPRRENDDESPGCQRAKYTESGRDWELVKYFCRALTS